jgi:hypothetical protein
MNLTSASHIGHQLDLHDGPSRRSSLEQLGSCSCKMAVLGFQALRSKRPRTGGGRLGKKTEPEPEPELEAEVGLEEAEAEAELEEVEIELGNFGGDAAGSVGRVAEPVAESVAAVPNNSQLAEGVVVVVGVGKYYTRVGQQVGAVDIVVEGAAGSGFVAQMLPRWAYKPYIQPG